jgi:hypothetical protein
LNGVFFPLNKHDTKGSGIYWLNKWARFLQH